MRDYVVFFELGESNYRILSIEEVLDDEELVSRIKKDIPEDVSITAIYRFREEYKSELDNLIKEIGKKKTCEPGKYFDLVYYIQENKISMIRCF